MTNDTVSRKGEISVYLGVGSNVGDRLANLREAIKRIKELGLEVVRESSIYETEPVGFRDQPWFLNQVIEVKVIGDPENKNITTIRAETLLSELLEIERVMGRERTIANGPRVIDIDLLLFGDMIISRPKQDDRPDIRVPHPRMHLRRFVLEPLCEIAHEVKHPVLKRTCRELLAALG